MHSEKSLCLKSIIYCLIDCAEKVNTPICAASIGRREPFESYLARYTEYSDSEVLES